MAILSAAAVPAISGMLSGPATKTAVNELMGAFEQARVAAMENGVNAYVGFAADDAALPADSQYRSYIIFRDKTEEDVSNYSYIQMSKWQRLPQGVSFKSTPFTTPGILDSLQTDSQGQPVVYTGIPTPGGSVPAAGLTFPVVEFTPTGAISSSATDLSVYLYQGAYTNGHDQFTPSLQPYLDRMSLAHYTGRIQVDTVKYSNPGS